MLRTFMQFIMTVVAWTTLITWIILTDWFTGVITAEPQIQFGLAIAFAAITALFTQSFIGNHLFEYENLLLHRTKWEFRGFLVTPTWIIDNENQRMVMGWLFWGWEILPNAPQYKPVNKMKEETI